MKQFATYFTHGVRTAPSCGQRSITATSRSRFWICVDEFFYRRNAEPALVS